MGQAHQKAFLFNGGTLMTNQEKIDIINSYQSNPMVHPLTCGVNSLHENLVPTVIGGEVFLGCPECDYIQPIDDEFLVLLAELDARQREFGKNLKSLFKKYRYVKEN